MGSYYTQSKRSTSSAGFTLVEVLVSLSIFTMVTTTAVGVLLVLIDSNRKAQNIQSAMNNISFALDSMTRDIRTGSHYYCHTDLPAVAGFDTTSVRNCSASDNADELSFNEGGNSLTSGCSGSNRRIAYRLNNSQIERTLCDDSSWVPITSSDVSIDTMHFTVSGVTQGDTSPPTATIFIVGSVTGVRGTAADFDIQTTVTQQILDI